MMVQGKEKKDEAGWEGGLVPSRGGKQGIISFMPTFTQLSPQDSQVLYLHFRGPSGSAESLATASG